jgi:hypothetical protein
MLRQRNNQGALMEKTYEIEKSMLSRPVKRVFCPFVNKPFEGCYCTSTSSLYTEATINYCGGNFKQCDIYGKIVGSKGFEI